ncbi:hypothetical protein [Serratia marcescens]|uniref:hypothetical protein n=1 Tax=Serratia marcescens TaxID=615 RepID=UPI00137475B8|nr:hypothetical protein [Serratia marcescens]
MIYFALKFQLLRAYQRIINQSELIVLIKNYSSLRLPEPKRSFGSVKPFDFVETFFSFGKGGKAIASLVLSVVAH